MKLPVEASTDADNESNEGVQTLLLPKSADGEKPASGIRKCRDRLFPNAGLNDEQLSRSASKQHKLSAMVTAFIASKRFQRLWGNNSNACMLLSE